MPKIGSDETVNVNSNLSPEAQKDLEVALNETASAQDAWVNGSRRDLYRSFAKGKIYDPMPEKGIDVVTAEEGTDKDLRFALNSIYEAYGPLDMYNVGLETCARHWVEGYQSIRGVGMVLKVRLHVTKTEWSGGCHVLDSLAAMIEAEETRFWMRRVGPLWRSRLDVAASWIGPKAGEHLKHDLFEIIEMALDSSGYQKFDKVAGGYDYFLDLASFSAEPSQALSTLQAYGTAHGRDHAP